jgi:hypothetical protein
VKTIAAAAALSAALVAAGSGAGAPEPTSWALMLVGFAGLGVMLRASRDRLVRVRA